ncbi:MAG: Regulatory protein [Ilumatobacteraceae bacterium]|nr:Regulatory protein [Ilumatobacteraceae bacterium]
MSVELTLPRDNVAPRAARRWVAERLTPFGLEDAMMQGILLAVSELVTNVVDHTDSDPIICLQVDPGVVEVRVADTSQKAAAVRTRDPDEPGGWGLMLVEQVADRWGTIVDGGTKIVWFAIDVDGPSPGQPHPRSPDRRPV